MVLLVIYVASAHPETNSKKARTATALKNTQAKVAATKNETAPATPAAKVRATTVQNTKKKKETSASKKKTVKTKRADLKVSESKLVARILSARNATVAAKKNDAKTAKKNAKETATKKTDKDGKEAKESKKKETAVKKADAKKDDLVASSSQQFSVVADHNLVAAAGGKLIMQLS